MDGKVEGKRGVDTKSHLDISRKALIYRIEKYGIGEPLDHWTVRIPVIDGTRARSSRVENAR